MIFLPIVKLRRFLRASTVGAINKAAGRVAGSPRLKRLVLRSLRRYPGIEIKIRSIYLRARFSQQRRSASWAGVSNNSAMNRLDDIVNSDVCSGSPLDGINANQRSPLEAHVHFYRGRF